MVRTYFQYRILINDTETEYCSMTQKRCKVTRGVPLIAVSSSQWNYNKLKKNVTQLSVSYNCGFTQIGKLQLADQTTFGELVTNNWRQLPGIVVG